MGRHARDHEPVPHPPEPSKDPARRGEASGSYRAPGQQPAEQAGPRPGETSGAYRTTGPRPSDLSNAFRKAQRAGETSGAYRAAPPAPQRPAEASGAFRTGGQQRPAEASGSFRTGGQRPAEGSGSFRSGGQRPAENSGSFRTAGPRPSEAPRPHRTAGPRPAETSGAFRTAGQRPGEPTTPVRSARQRLAETTGGFRTTATRPEPPRVPAREELPDATRIDVPAPIETTKPSRFPDTAPPKRSRRGASDANRTAERPARPVKTRPVKEKAEKLAPKTAEPSRSGRRRAAEKQMEMTGTLQVTEKRPSEVTGSHRIVGKKAPRRRIAKWPIACLVLLVLIGLGVFGWNWADSELNTRAEAQAESCSAGASELRVVVTPAAEKPVGEAATAWNQANTVVFDHCVHVTIAAYGSQQVLDALSGKAKLDAIGGLPAAWLPESSYWASMLTTTKPELISSPAQSVASSPSADYPYIGLAGNGLDDTALRAAQAFRQFLVQPAQQNYFAAAGITK